MQRSAASTMNPLTWTAGVLSLVGPLTWDQSGLVEPAGTALRVIETHKPLHHDKVAAQGEEQERYCVNTCLNF